MMRLRVMVVGLALGAGLPALARAQSITAGEVAGSVTDSIGRTLDAADVIMLDRSSGIERTATVDRDGNFRFALLPPGEYEVFAERLGYRPRRVLGVPVRPGVTLTVTVILTPAPPPVNQVDTSFFVPGVYGGASTGVNQWFTPFSLLGLPDRTRTVNAVAGLATNAEETLESEGLPASFSNFVVDGVSFMPVRHPGLTAGDIGAALPRGSFTNADWLNGGPDVEWSGVAGGTLSAFSRQGTAQPVARGFADWTGAVASNSKFFNTGAVPNNSMRGGLLITGPIIPDTAHFVVGVEAERLQTPRPAAWTSDSIVGVARDSFNTNLSAYARPRLATTQRVALFGRLDWQLSDDNTLGVSAHYANSKETDADLGLGALPSLGSSLSRSDFIAAATLASALSPTLSSELRAGVEVNSLTDTAFGPPGTWLPSAGAGFGSDPGLAGQFQRTAIIGRETMSWKSGRHRLKFGAEVTVPSYQVTYAYGEGGVYSFGGVSQFGLRQGEFVQTVGTVPTAQFSVFRYGGFLQDTWNAAPGFDVLIGARFEAERLPQSDVQVNTPWQQATGLKTNALPGRLSEFSPRVGFSWDVGQRHAWQVTGEGGTFYSAMDPAVLTALLTEDGGNVQVRRGLGALVAPWPAVPDSANARLMGPRLTLLGPNFQTPRSRHFAAGVTGALGHGFELGVSGAYRHTDFLERRTDLNLPLGANGQDQYGRPLYGTLVQEGGLLAAQPGSNRRFSGFDLVSALNPDGFSDYWGITFALERTVGEGIRLSASYTYSQTTDNWLSGRSAAGDPEGQLSPFPGGLAGADWSKGTSDFDVPHRITLAADLTLRRLHQLHLIALFHYRSGYPFTPGFRPGVDANGDGSGGNDPAFVDDTVSGMASVMSKWSCLRTQVGRFADRNVCREPGVTSFDLRLEAPVVTVGGYPLSVVVDAFNLLESDVGTVDQALYLVDPTRSITTAAGVTHVPLIANQNFGNILVRNTTGRYLRVGVRVNW